MKYLLWIVGLFAAAVALTVATQNSAYVQLVYPPYRVEVSLTMFIALLLLAFMAVYGLLRLMRASLGLPMQVREFRLRQAQAKSRKLLDEVIYAFFEGRYAAAEKAAARAIQLGDPSALHPIIAARSAHELGEYKKRDAYLDAVEGKATGDSTMRLLATTKFMLDRRDPQAALEALQELRDSGVKRHSGALALELRAHQQVGDWDEVLLVINQMEKLASVSALEATQIRQQAWLGEIRLQKDLAGLLACLKSVPAEIKQRSKFAATTARALIQQGGASFAHQLLSDSLNAHWDGDLVVLYGDCQSGDLTAQIEQAEKWLGLHNQEAGLLLTLGKLCLHQKLWGKALNYLEASTSLMPSRAAYNALGQLAEQSGKANEAAKYYRQALQLTAKSGSKY